MKDTKRSHSHINHATTMLCDPILATRGAPEPANQGRIARLKRPVSIWAPVEPPSRGARKNTTAAASGCAGLQCVTTRMVRSKTQRARPCKEENFSVFCRPLLESRVALSLTAWLRLSVVAYCQWSVRAFVFSTNMRPKMMNRRSLMPKRRT
ncbi:hypothetical protein M440DRAFT_1396070 [Trichoderma longibrachiatum ATCC 18648]|uniref:Uncharacterized protein n=1 Tax=Trichoderma longibrachiatum ATCC 18648 TaxID=983965 RepID=A0A2T4CH86_TRILO|nr:hypothetical protein M440DRAFT_1396070 [Trichoderma longibrachiatum ATCC 18648]